MTLSTLPPLRWTGQAGGRVLLRALDAESGRTRLVGGAVRDALAGRPVSDVDLATEFEPEEVIARLQAAGIKAVPTGLAHGTVTAVADSLVAEVTTLRRDVETNGRHADVAYTSDWREDAARRDFTINAMNARLPEGAVSDYFGGLADLEAGRVRFIGDPLARIAEDHLRILRFFRFHQRFGAGAPDDAAMAACTARANDLMALSRERIAMELMKMLAAEDPAGIMALTVENGIWRPVIPEFDGAGLARLQRLVLREKQTHTAPDPVRRLAALLPADAEIAAGVAQRLRLSKVQRQRLVAAAKVAGAGPNVRVNAHFRGLETALDWLLLAEKWQPEAARTLANHRPRKLPVSGKDLIARGLQPGPEVSRRLQALERDWAESGFPVDDAALESLIERALRND